MSAALAPQISSSRAPVKASTHGTQRRWASFSLRAAWRIRLASSFVYPRRFFLGSRFARYFTPAAGLTGIRLLSRAKLYSVLSIVRWFLIVVGLSPKDTSLVFQPIRSASVTAA